MKKKLPRNLWKTRRMNPKKLTKLLKKKLIPKSFRRMGKAKKIIGSVQKHQDTYLRGIHAISYGMGILLKSKE